MKLGLMGVVLALVLAACSSTGAGSSQMYGQVSGGVGYTTSQ